MTENQWQKVCEEFSQINANILFYGGYLGKGQEQIMERLAKIETELETIKLGFPKGVIP